jgi:hypothetical protein
LSDWIKQRNNLVGNIKIVPLGALQLLRRLSVGKLGGSELVRLVSVQIELEIYACIIWARKTFRI